VIPDVLKSRHKQESKQRRKEELKQLDSLAQIQDHNSTHVAQLNGQQQQLEGLRSQHQEELKQHSSHALILDHNSIHVAPLLHGQYKPLNSLALIQDQGMILVAQRHNDQPQPEESKSQLKRQHICLQTRHSHAAHQEVKEIHAASQTVD